MVNQNHIRLAVLVLALLSLAVPAVSESSTDRHAGSKGKEIQICVAEIRKRANYGEATRVVHTVAEERKNIAEQQFRINTLIYSGSKETAVREYYSLCVTRGPIELVSFRIDNVAQATVY